MIPNESEHRRKTEKLLIYWSLFENFSFSAAYNIPDTTKRHTLHPFLQPLQIPHFWFWGVWVGRHHCFNTISERSLPSFSQWPCKKVLTFSNFSDIYGLAPDGNIELRYSHALLLVTASTAPWKCCHNTEVDRRAQVAEKRFFHLCQVIFWENQSPSQLTTWTHRQRLCQLGRGQAEQPEPVDGWELFGLMRKLTWICGQISPLQGFHPGCTCCPMEPRAVPWSPSTALPLTWKGKAILVPCKPLQIFSLFPISSQSHGRNPFKYVHSNKLFIFAFNTAFFCLLIADHCILSTT